MSDEGRGAAATPRRWWLLVAAGAIAALLVLWFVVRDGDSSSPTPSSGPSAAAPSGSASGGPSSNGALAIPSTIDSAVPSAPPAPKKTRKPVRAAFGVKAPLGRGLVVTVTDIESVKGTARGVGEVAGPAVRFTVQVKNAARESVNLDLAVLTAYYGPKNRPANELSGPGASPLPQRLAGGRSATGRWVFAIPPEKRDRVRLDFSYDARSATAVFRGSARSAR